MNVNNDDYGNPYGDLQDSRPQHSTFAYDDRHDNAGNDDESRGLIKAPPSEKNPESESDLAMAVVDILSCCDGRLNPNQAKIMKEMGNRYKENGNLTIGDVEKQEQFSDEDSLLQKFSPRKWFRGLADSGQKYVTRSSRTITGPLPVGRESFSSKDDAAKEKATKITYLVAAIVAVLVLVVVISLSKLAQSTTKDSIPPEPILRVEINSVSLPSSDCSLVASQSHPSPLSQCACTGAIAIVSDEAIQRYDEFLNVFGGEYLHANETMDSCSSRNQALVWLSEDKGSTLSDVLIQRHTLVLFYIKMRGLSWTLDTTHQKWLTTAHECTWFGIACNEEKKVTAIELWNLSLEGSIPKEIMSLTSLERLSLPENNIRGHLPIDAFVMMSKLTDLTLFMNSISGSIDSRIIDSVAMLKTLNLDSNNLTGPIPTEVGKLTDLVELKLARNNLLGELPTELGNLKVLKKIELEENNIFGTLPSELGRLFHLEALNLSWNNLQGGPIPWQFQGLLNLRDLFLKSNNLGGTLPTALTVMGKLENLVLSLNAFTGELPSGMAQMSSLTTVHLDENKLNGTIPAELGSCSFIRDIRLDYNEFSGAIPTEIGQLAWLISFSLEGNSFTGSMPPEVCNLRGDLGTLETLSATCTAETSDIREKEVFMRHNEFVCQVPDCCTSCELKS